MPDPKQHSESRGWIESFMRYIPGFRGYLEKEYRRESDVLARKWMADRLDRVKSNFDVYMNQLVSDGDLAAMNPCQQLRTKIDLVVGRFRSAPEGYSGFFDYVQIDEGVLDAVYEHDMQLMKQVDAAASAIENLATSPEPAAQAVPPLTNQVNEINTLFDRRGEILNGLAD